jgi:hypothetical protein
LLLIDRLSPSLDHIYQLGLWSAISSLFFFDFRRTNFSGFRRTFHQFRSGWLCYFCYSRAGRLASKLGFPSATEGDQDHGRIPVAVPVIAGRLHHPLHLALGQVLTGPIMDVGENIG